MNEINIKKAIGADGILAKIVKNYKSYIAPQLTALVNLSIKNNCFPDKLKEAQVTPIFKKEESDPLMKTNYRPVSVLPIFSKKNWKSVWNSIIWILW